MSPRNRNGGFRNGGFNGVPDCSALKTGLLIPLAVQGLAGSERRS
jgi:hypothetical protein